ncbi:MAG: hypothetical protein U9Q20_00235 [Campylobacterota bacterium]|nr:hypothetical protein [Campylobacterota bacterium]
MKKILLLLVLNIYLFSCSLCVLDVPIVNTSTKIKYDTNQTIFNVTWEFNKKFVESLSMYDTNQDKTFDTNELKEVKLTLEDYLLKTNFLTDIFYESRGVEYSLDKLRSFKSKTTDISFKDGHIFYNFEFNLNIVLQKNYFLYIQYHDYGGNFNFQIKDLIIENYNKFKMIEPNENNVNIFFYKESDEIIKPKETQVKKDEIQDIKKEQTFIEILSEQLDIYKTKIELLLKDIKENNSFISYFWLLLFSFIYGVIHAIGPGHGKSLVSAYFLNEDKSFTKAFNISLLIGVVHTFSAFILTLVIYYILNTIFTNYFTNIEYIATKISAVIIITIALYLIFKKIKTVKQNIKSSTHNSNTHSCSCGGCKTNSTDLGVILAAGIVPCPGTVTIFIFTMSLGIYFVGFLSAVFMSLGMSLIIFIMAYLSIKVKTKTSNNSFLVKLFEYGSLVFILFLGFILLLTA